MASGLPRVGNRERERVVQGVTRWHPRRAHSESLPQTGSFSPQHQLAPSLRDSLHPKARAGESSRPPLSPPPLPNPKELLETFHTPQFREMQLVGPAVGVPSLLPAPDGSRVTVPMRSERRERVAVAHRPGSTQELSDTVPTAGTSPAPEQPVAAKIIFPRAAPSPTRTGATKWSEYSILPENGSRAFVPDRERLDHANFGLSRGLMGQEDKLKSHAAREVRMQRIREHAVVATAARAAEQIRSDRLAVNRVASIAQQFEQYKDRLSKYHFRMTR